MLLRLRAGLKTFFVMDNIMMNEHISKRSFLSRTGSLFVKMGRGLTKRTTIVEIICSLLIILFIYTGLNKMLDYAKFKAEMGRSPFIESISSVIAVTLPIGELLMAFLLIIKRTRLLGLYLSLFTMFLFTGYVWLMLNYAYDLPCSCGGILAELSWQDHLKFNASFTLLAIVGIYIETSIKNAIEYKITKLINAL
jgi:hypothetical protein